MPPQVFRLSQTAGPLLIPQARPWGNVHEAPPLFANCHIEIAGALAAQRHGDVAWWSAMLNRHMDELVRSYMDGCRSAREWNLTEMAQVHWYAFAVKARLRAARHFPRVWNGAGRCLTALEAIQSS